MDVHGYNWREEPRGIALSSVLLLLVFIAAAGFMMSMILFRPWADGGTPAQPVAEAQETPAAPAADAAQTPPTEPAPGP